MGFILGLVLGVVLAVAGAWGFLQTGRWDPAADKPPAVAFKYLFDTGIRPAVKARAADIAAPPVEDPAMSQDGARAYGELCEACHGGPGVEPGMVGQALSPRPADLAVVGKRWTPAEMFWIVKHGLQGTGMPAFGVAKVDAELWPVVAFAGQLPGMTPQRYAELVRPPKTESEPQPPAASEAPPEQASPEPPPPVEPLHPPRE